MNKIKTVEEIVEEFEVKFNKPVSRDFIEAVKDPHVYADLTKQKDWLTHTLTQDRLALKEELLSVQRDLESRMAHSDHEYCMTCDETLHHLKTLTKAQEIIRNKIK